ncbi:LOW QUALITY PROTEIN: hypothetical protein HID58_021502 [Brassica napus]|uniref:Uncharacterized protein n=1 Tax=Brassica napus TaxID=3708 RepID=A0ABQ8CWR6_BRANA|nr:LOW QUALITY PROTEIN: hypothetical protein HID58_021502 [Brassica napus]
MLPRGGYCLSGIMVCDLEVAPTWHDEIIKRKAPRTFISLEIHASIVFHTIEFIGAPNQRSDNMRLVRAPNPQLTKKKPKNSDLLVSSAFSVESRRYWVSLDTRVTYPLLHSPLYRSRMDSNNENPQDPPYLIIEAQPKSFGVAAEGEAALPQTPNPDLRWPYLGRWLASLKPIIPAIPPSLKHNLMFHRFLTLLLLMLLIPLPYSLLLLKPPPLLLLLQLPSLLLKPSPFQPPAILVVATTKFHLPSGSFTQKLNPLRFTPPHTPSEPATPRLGISEAVKIQIASFWPSLGETIKIGQKQQKGKLFSVQAAPQLPVEKILPPTLKDDGSLRFPWAVRMNQSSRNFYRAAEPTYQLYDTPQVTIPSKRIIAYKGLLRG